MHWLTILPKTFDKYNKHREKYDNSWQDKGLTLTKRVEEIEIMLIKIKFSFYIYFLLVSFLSIR